jgi:hypothetical protein
MIVSGFMTTSVATTQDDKIAKPEDEVATSTQAAVISSVSTSTTTKQSAQNPNQGVEQAIKEYFNDIPLMAEIAYCESRFRQFDKDGSIFRGIVNNKDVGVLQVNEYYHLERATKLGIDIHTVEGNMAYSRILYKESGARPWNSSAPCWMRSEVAKQMFGTNQLLASNK